jgi:ATP-dependent Clp protease ATP-binding subunit ClpA
MKREPQHLICRLADEAAALSRPEAALAKLRQLREELERFEHERVAEALRSGSSFGAIARALGISRQAAHRRYRDLAPMAIEKLRLSSHSRRAVQLACHEADAAGADGAASEHLLLGVLRSGGGTSVALEAIGVTGDAVRKCITGATAIPGRGGEADAAGRAVLAQAAEIARARNARYVDPEHIVLAALDGEDGGAARAVTAIGVTPASVRERLGCAPDHEDSGVAA